MPTLSETEMLQLKNKYYIVATQATLPHRLKVVQTFIKHFRIIDENLYTFVKKPFMVFLLLKFHVKFNINESKLDLWKKVLQNLPEGSPAKIAKEKPRDLQKFMKRHSYKKPGRKPRPKFINIITTPNNQAILELWESYKKLQVLPSHSKIQSDVQNLLHINEQDIAEQVATEIKNNLTLYAMSPQKKKHTHSKKTKDTDTEKETEKETEEKKEDETEEEIEKDMEEETEKEEEEIEEDTEEEHAGDEEKETEQDEDQKRNVVRKKYGKTFSDAVQNVLQQNFNTNEFTQKIAQLVPLYETENNMESIYHVLKQHAAHFQDMLTYPQLMDVLAIHAYTLKQKAKSLYKKNQREERAEFITTALSRMFEAFLFQPNDILTFLQNPVVPRNVQKQILQKGIITTTKKKSGDKKAFVPVQHDDDASRPNKIVSETQKVVELVQAIEALQKTNEPPSISDIYEQFSELKNQFEIENKKPLSNVLVIRFAKKIFPQSVEYQKHFMQTFFTPKKGM